MLSVTCFCPHFWTLKSQPWEVLTSLITGADGGHLRGLFESGRCEELTDCHQCEAGLLIALVYKFSHGHSDSGRLKAGKTDV